MVVSVIYMDDNHDEIKDTLTRVEGKLRFLEDEVDRLHDRVEQLEDVEESDEPSPGRQPSTANVSATQ